MTVLTSLDIRRQVALAPLTTLGVGGPARYFLSARGEDEVREGLAFAAERDLPVFVLGGGSNLVVADAGWPGLVLQIALDGVRRRSEGGRAVFEAGAGVAWDAFVARTVEAGCAGLECLSGIPGTVGGTPVQNVGAYGQEVRDTILGVLALEMATGETRWFDNAACGFAYRASRFNTAERGRWIVLRVDFALAPDGAPKIAYADLERHFAGRTGTPSLAEVRDAVRAIRHAKGMLLVPDEADCRSAGSFFKNPLLTPAEHEALLARLPAGTAVPSHPAGGRVKVSAAWLVERAGFGKGYAHGRVGISTRHSLAMVNRGGATAAEVVAFKDAIQARVQEAFGVELQPEPVFVGF